MRNTGINLQLNVNNLMVSYNDEGPESAPCVVFIHGFPFNKFMWTPQFESFKGAFRVITYDVRGHGSSDAGNEDFSIDLFVEDLLAFLDNLGLDKVALCGLSMGGYIALKAMEKYPGRFSALVLSDTQCIADTPEAKAKRMSTIEKIKKSGVKKYAEDSLPHFFAPATLKEKPAAIEAIKEMILETPESVLCKTLLALANREETCKLLSAIKVPTLILVGEEDKITPPTVARQMQGKIHNARLTILKNAGHLANLENVTQFNAQVEEFLVRSIVLKSPAPVFF